MAENLDTNQSLVRQNEGSKEFFATPYFENYLYEIIKSLGGAGSTIITNISNIISTLDKADYFFGKIKTLEDSAMGFVGKVKTINYTAIAKDWVEARSNAVISLPLDPLVNDQVIVSNGDGSLIKVEGNGNDIKYTTTDTSIIIRVQGTSLHFQLFEFEGTKYWRIR